MRIVIFAQIQVYFGSLLSATWC